MRCEDAEELLLKQQDGELTHADSTALQEHLAGCERCRRFRDALRRVEGFLEAERGAPPVVRDPSALWMRVSQGLVERERTVCARSAGTRWVRGAAMAAAAAVVIGLVATSVLWWRVMTPGREVTALKRADVAQRAGERPGSPPVGAETQQVVAESVAGLEQSGRLYRELADFYRVPILWVAETEEGVEMKLASEAVRGASAGDAEIILAVVTLRDRRVPSVRTSVRVTSRPGEHVTATLEGWPPAPGLWHLECMAAPTRAPASPTRAGEVDLSLAVRYADDAGQAALTTQATVTPGAFTELGSLQASGRIYEVEVVTQRSKVTGVGTGAKAGGGTL
jgi:hypothetical protein